MTPLTGARDILTQSEAEGRAARIAGAAYTLDIRLTRGAPTYRGDVTIQFPLSGEGDTFLDFRGKTIERLEINGAVSEPDWTGYRLTLPAAALREQNLVRVTYENEYDHTGDGLHQFIDPEDGEEYVYTNFEPYESHRLFPNFDQPDIKGSYMLAVTAPTQWEVITNSPEVAADAAGDGRVRRVYGPTARFSTYLFALVAGPYHAFRDRHGDIPLGFFARKSLVKYVDIDELFVITKQGLDFFASFFDYPYPFKKYDQVFVPEFNAGAMENVGAVTHSEFMVYRDLPTENQRSLRAEVILHEMAHMWFGDLVTMRWWNDLWLNESFASYMAYLAQTRATRFTAAWQEFNARMKNWAYRQDQLVTTHAIAGRVADTDQTFLNFDGITYGKGAAVLKQLVATIGLDGFREGMRRYFRRHEYGNATLSQFLDALEEGAGRDLHEWARLWLETASLNTVSAAVELDGERVTSLRLTQTAPAGYPTLRPHALEVALGREEGGRIVVESLPAEIAGAEAEVPAAVGRPSPAFVVPNHNDQTFAKVALDEASVGYLKQNLERVEDPLLRQLIWQALWNMVRDQQFKSTEYLSLCSAKLPLERDRELVETTLKCAEASIARYVPEDLRLTEAHRFADAAWQALSAMPQGDLQIIWARALINVSINPEDILRVGRLADGETAVEGLAVDQEMRWEIAARFVAYGLPGAVERLAGERERDPSDRGQRAALRAGVAAPDAAAKAEAWRRFHEEGYGSLHLTSAAMAGFNWTVQRELLAPYIEDFFQRVPAVFERGENEFAHAYFGALFPGYRVEGATLDRSERLLAEAGDRSQLLARSLREANDDLARAIKCRAFAAG